VRQLPPPLSLICHDATDEIVIIDALPQSHDPPHY